MDNVQTLLAGQAEPGWDNTAMSGTAKRVTSAVELGDSVREVSWGLPWTNTGTVIGGFGVEECNEDPDGSPLWNPVPAADLDLPTVNNNAGPGMVRARCLGRYARLVYTNVSGTGVLGTPTAQGKLY